MVDALAEVVAASLASIPAASRPRAVTLALCASRLAVLPGGVELDASGVDGGALTEIAARVLCAPRLADAPLEVFTRVEKQAVTPFGSNAPACLGATHAVAILSGPGAIGATKPEPTIWVVHRDGLAVHENAGGMPRIELVRSPDVRFFARSGSRLGVATRHEGFLTLDGERSCGPATGRWRTVGAALETFWAAVRELGPTFAADADPSTLAEDDMASLGVMLRAFRLAFWPTFERLFRAGRLEAVKTLAAHWPREHEDFQHVTYARLWFSLESGRRAEVRAFLEGATAEEWPRLFRHNDRLNDEPNLFERVALWEKAAAGHRRTLRDASFLEHTNGYGVGRVWTDLAFCLLRLGRVEEAWDALTEAHRHDLDSMEARVAFARFHCLLEDDAKAFHWVDRALLKVDTPARGAHCLSEMVAARLDRGSVLTEVQHADFDRIRDSLGKRLLSRKIPAATADVERRSQRASADISKLLGVARTWLEEGQLERASADATRALSRLEKATALDLGALPHELVALRGAALRELGRAAESLDAFERVQAFRPGVTTDFAREFAAALEATGDRQRAERWMRRAPANDAMRPGHDDTKHG